MNDPLLIHDDKILDRQTLALKLEEELLAIENPTIEHIVSPGDIKTAEQDFITVAEATRYAALLSIYRVFPAILEQRLGFPSLTDTFVDQDQFTDSSSDHPNLPDPAAHDYRRIQFLNSLAEQVLYLLESIPQSSGTRPLQLLLLIVSASELRFMHNVNLDFLDLTSGDLKVRHARRFAEARLREHSLRLPAKPVLRMIELVKEVWRRVDGGDGECFWVDVMVEKGWETVMG
ncbi:hypothetical protein LTS18_012808 [Coniosporium uncinatum]|uniref:Uncharacterized protein n=1 Tax=Coniosporium uncinatum TaxID=93489 RepID=A0ACC3DIM5_9PEZI|nr:hypothetical protein LTS18_012808 [Coniosporium uncinatum]